MTDDRVNVVAGNVADVVRCAGGWIFDSVLDGWAVNVVVPYPVDARPIEILGATATEPTGSQDLAPRMFLQDAVKVVELHGVTTATSP